MGFPAARRFDNHLCPMVTPGLPPVPHVGGLIIGPCVPNVLIGGLSAATFGDMCICVGPFDSIVKGSSSVFIGGKPAARMFDRCAHGGMVVKGCMSVWIGDVASPATVAAIQASATGTPFFEICNPTTPPPPPANNAGTSSNSLAPKTSGAMPKNDEPQKPAAKKAAIVFGKNATNNLSSQTIEVINDIAQKTGETNIIVTSTQREPKDQSRIMYDNIESKGVASQKELYGANGDKVIDVYAEGKKQGLPREEIEKNMTDKINELGPSNVSKHMADSEEMNVVDISPAGIKDKKKFVEALKNDPRISKVLEPPNDPAYHIEIPQNK